MPRQKRSLAKADPKAAERMRAFRTNNRGSAAFGAAMAVIMANTSQDDWDHLAAQLRESRLSLVDLQELSAILIGYATGPDGRRVQEIERGSKTS